MEEDTFGHGRRGLVEHHGVGHESVHVVARPF